MIATFNPYKYFYSLWDRLITTIKLKWNSFKIIFKTSKIYEVTTSQLSTKKLRFKSFKSVSESDKC